MTNKKYLITFAVIYFYTRELNTREMKVSSYTNLIPLNRKNQEQENYRGKDKIVLLKCPLDGRECRKHVTQINKVFHESTNYRHNKEYQLSIMSLKNAYNKTYELQDASCSKCAHVFRSTIRESLENIKSELKRMTTGFFRKNHYKGSYLLVQNTLENLRSNI